MSARCCTVPRADGRPCRATPLRGSTACFWHAPESSDEAAEARHLGGLRRRREKTLAGAYDVIGIADVEGLRRVLEIAVFDAFSLENSVARSRLLIAAVAVGVRLLETGDHEARIASLEAALRTASVAAEAPPYGGDGFSGEILP